MACAIRPSDVTFPGDGFAPTRVGSDVRGDARRAARRGSAGARAGPGDATAELVAWSARAAFPRSQAAAGMTVRSPTARASRCGRMSRWRSTEWRPPRAGRPASSSRHERLPLRCRAGAPVRRAPGPEVGGAARREPPPLRHRARPRANGGVRLARPRTRPGSASCSATPGSRGTTASPAAREARRWASARPAGTAGPPAPSSHSSPRGSRR